VAILAGDIKLVESQVMDDVPEGGGAPTANIIQDGESNNIFPDISEVDRAGGRINMRKVHVHVQTDNRDTYLGGNVIVAEPPDDPNVSITLFSTESTFDRRSEAQTRVEAYLNKGPELAGFLYENHIAGQRVVQIFQRTNDLVPNVGQTLVLVYNEGLPGQKEQYVRATDVSVVERTFTYNGDQDYKANIVTVSISDALRYDFTGSPSTREFKRASNGTKIRDTVVADAGTYVGVVPLAESASIGDFTVRGSSIFTQLVPSAQTETAISDVRTNGLSFALVATGAPLTVELTLAFTTAQNLHVGGPILPKSLSLVRSGVTLTDDGGLLKNGDIEVGQVDYDNGVLSLSTNVFGVFGGTHTVTFTPAAIPDLVSEQSVIRISAESRSQSYAFTMGTPPLPRTMSVSYLAQGRWYVLRDSGGGKLAGLDSSYGAGTVSYTTGSVVITLGALPDVGSSIVVQAYSDASQVLASNTTLRNAGKVYAAINADGVASESSATKKLTPGDVSVSWTRDGSTYSVADDGVGGLSGDGTGTVDYSAGVVRVSPSVLPPPGTVFLLDSTSNDSITATDKPIASGLIGDTNIMPGSVLISCELDFIFDWDAYSSGLNLYYEGTETISRDSVIFDRAGTLYFQDRYGDLSDVACGTINYTTGAYTITAPSSLSSVDRFGPIVHGNVSGTTTYGAWSGTTFTRWDNYTGPKTRSVFVPIGGRKATIPYATGSASADSASATINELRASVLATPLRVLRGVNFNLGAKRYVQLADNTLSVDPDPMTGGGTPAGSVIPALGAVAITDWDGGIAPTITDWRGLLVPPTTTVEAPFSAFQTVFRTAASPIRPGSISVLGTMQDGTTFNVTAGTDGKINGTRVKGRVSFEYGLVELYFVNPSGSSDANVDLSFLGISGLTTIPADLAMLNTVRYNAVAYSYLPLDADLLGIDPVRLPSDGRVPIFRPGGFAVVGNTASMAPATVSNGQTLDTGRTRLSRVRVVGNDGATINTGYSTDLEAGTVTFDNVTGYSQPVTVEHRIEDMAVVSDVQINGEITFTRPLTHAYGTSGTYISSALMSGDLRSRVSTLFDQASWDGTTWADTVSGAPATGTYNDVLAPVLVTNAGAVTERWALRFTSTTAFQVIGEHVGVIATGSINATCAPVNPATGEPYFTISDLGWGTGWSVGNILRLNTVGAQFPVWAVRTVQQGPEAGTNYSFSLLTRGDVDRP